MFSNVVCFITDEYAVRRIRSEILRRKWIWTPDVRTEDEYSFEKHRSIHDRGMDRTPMSLLMCEVIWHRPSSQQTSHTKIRTKTTELHSMHGASSWKFSFDPNMQYSRWRCKRSSVSFQKSTRLIFPGSYVSHKETDATHNRNRSTQGKFVPFTVGMIIVAVEIASFIKLVTKNNRLVECFFGSKKKTIFLSYTYRGLSCKIKLEELSKSSKV